MTAPFDAATRESAAAQAAWLDTIGMPFTAEIIRAALAEIDRLEAERDRMRAMLMRAAEQFDRYAELHRAKGPDGAGKARTNALFAQWCRAALAPAPAAEGDPQLRQRNRSATSCVAAPYLTLAADGRDDA
jgi:hypothetical protein